jgi:hypothetical protein
MKSAKGRKPQPSTTPSGGPNQPPAVNVPTKLKGYVYHVVMDLLFD